MNQEQLQSELLSIRHLMERSAKFISLSGLSGILAGCYALVGAALAYGVMKSAGGNNFSGGYTMDVSIAVQLIPIALGVLLLSVGTAIWLSGRKAQKQKQHIWNPASRGLLKAVGVPLVAGGLFVLVLMGRGGYELIIAACLIFYGLALVAGGQYTYSDVRGLGMLQVVLGLVAAWWPGYGLVCWSLGFGVLHILYGCIMYVKYDRRVG